MKVMKKEVHKALLIERRNAKKIVELDVDLAKVKRTLKSMQRDLRILVKRKAA